MKSIDEILEYLEYGTTAEYYLERLYAELNIMDEGIDLSQWAEEDKNRLKERLIECRENMLHHDNLGWLLSTRQKFNIPREMFWWYMDEL